MAIRRTSHAVYDTSYHLVWCPKYRKKIFEGGGVRERAEQLIREIGEEYGFEINPYDPCVANKIVNGKQLTITWHVDDLKASHVDMKVLDQFVKWLEKKYGSDGVNKVKVHKGKLHDYLAMNMDYSVKGEVRIEMKKYVKDMIKDFPENITKGASNPASDKLFHVHNSPALDDERTQHFHHFVARGLFVAKRARPDIQPAIAFLCTRVKAPTEEDWYKLVRMMKFFVCNC